MKFAPIVAMLLVAVDCFAQGAGVETQVLFSDPFIWLWHVTGACWVATALLFYFE